MSCPQPCLASIVMFTLCSERREWCLWLPQDQDRSMILIRNLSLVHHTLSLDDSHVIAWGHSFSFAFEVSSHQDIGDLQRRKKGVMTTLTVVLPLLPGKQEAWRRFCQTLQGSRCREYDAWQERIGITKQEIWLSQTLHMDLVRVHLQVEHPEYMLADLAASHRPFDRWLRQQLLELYGLDLMQLASASAHELLFVWQPASFPEAASAEEQNHENKERNN